MDVKKKPDVLLWFALMQTDFVQLEKKASLLVSQSGPLTAFKEALFGCSVGRLNHLNTCSTRLETWKQWHTFFLEALFLLV